MTGPQATHGALLTREGDWIAVRAGMALKEANGWVRLFRTRAAALAALALDG